MWEKDPKLRPLRANVSTPLWLQLKHALRDLITFDLAPGDRIPSESVLGEHYELSRITVRQAITALVDEGFLHRQHGRGTFVLAARLAEPLADPDHFLFSGFDGADQDHVLLFSAETVPAAEWIAEKLGLPAGEPVHKIRKVLSPDGPPAAFRTTFVPERLVPRLLEADLAPPLHSILEELYGLMAADAEEMIEFIIADDFRADMLQAPLGHPLILIERVTYARSGEAIECSRTYYRADRFRLRRRLTRKVENGPSEARARTVHYESVD